MIAQAIFRAALLLAAADQRARNPEPDFAVWVSVDPGGPGECADGDLLDWDGAMLWHPCERSVAFYVAAGRKPPPDAWIIYPARGTR